MILGNVAAASLAHDIESAFGHSGEKAIGSIFDRKRTKIQRPTYRKRVARFN
jgi:dGTP triphosphohydrolase